MSNQIKDLENKAEDICNGIDQLKDYLSVFMLLGDTSGTTESIISEIQSQEAQEAQVRAEAVHISNDLPEVRKGPLVAKLDDVLKSFRVNRQAYHGKSFVGNHIHKCCKPENIKTLMTKICKTATELCPEIEENVVSVTTKYGRLFNLFGICHRQYNCASFFTEEMILKLESDIEDYVQFFRKHFQETEPPKMHILEEHVSDWIKRWKFGLGFHGEQGGESMHAQLNTLKSNIRGFNDDLGILTSAMKEHWVKTSPSMLAAKP
ncbi:uncharacterized protein [Antedon mediterranea]|uniref:uncharacterized protein n=1 Tax=Antedon mediterranea TaxID=105859 RepID=UPI003AF49820